MLVISVTREEFFKQFPPAKRNVTVNGVVVANLGEEVVCDLCNADVLTEENNAVFLVLTNSEKGSYINSTICKDCREEFRKKGL